MQACGNNVSRHVIALAMFLVVFHAFVFSQPKQMIFENLSDEDGLISNQVITIFQDSRGFIWLGTSTGLSRFDGYQFENFEYGPDNPNSLIGKEVRQIREDSLGYLWIATNGGLNMYHPGKNTFTRYTNDPSDPRSLLANHVNSIFIDSLQNLWVCGPSGLQYFDRQSQKFSVFPPDSFTGYPMDNMEIRNIWFNHDKKIMWVLPMPEKGIFKLDLVKGEISLVPVPGFDKWQDKQLFRTGRDRLFILQYDGLLVEFMGKGKIKTLLGPEDYPEAVDGMVFQTLAKIGDKIWIGSNEGLYIFNPENRKFDLLTHEKGYPEGISSSNVQDILVGKFNSIWLANLEAGVDVWHRDKQKFKSLFYQQDDENSLSAGGILSITEARDGHIWIASDGYGLNRLNPNNGHIKHFVHDPDNPGKSFSNNSVLAVEETLGLIFTGHWGGGLTRYNPAREIFRVYRHRPGNENSLPSDNIWHIHESSDGRLLIATFKGGGLSFFDPRNGSFENYLHDPDDPSSLSDNYCYYVYEDRQGTVWVGTAGHGLNRFHRESGTFLHYLPDKKVPGSLSQKTVTTIYEDTRNRFWVGTAAGLNRMDRQKGTFKIYYKKDGLADNAVRHIMEDNKGTLWVTTANGLSRFVPEKEGFKNYSRADGLLNKEFLSGSGCVTSDGFVYLGGRKGVNYFHPDSMKKNTVSPEVVFTGLKIYNQPVGIGDSINNRIILKESILVADTLILTYREDIFSLSFAALHYLAPMKNQYKYKLEGYNDKWISTGADHRFATYTNLEPGEYTFRVIASNNDGIWNKEGASMAIIIMPPWWQTWWFRSLVTVFLIGSLIALYFWRVHSLKTRQRELEQSVSERTAELEEANAELIEQKEEISQQKMAISEQNMVLRNQKEELQVAADEINAAAQSKIRFFMNVSHEFRTPLTLILGPLETIMQKTKEPFVQNQLLVVHRNAKRLLRLVNQLLDLRRLETGTMKLHASKDDIVLFLKNIHESFQYLAKRHRIKYEFISGLDQWYTWFDHDIIEKMIYNLLSNSFKFTPDGHSISLSVEKAPLNEGDPLCAHLEGKSISPREQGLLIIRVKDTGTGIDPEFINKIFERFYTYQDKTIRKKSGTGIGLALTKELVETHHGDIKAKENLDQGAEFVVRLLVGKDILEPSQVGQQKENVKIDKYPHITDNIEDLENPVEVEQWAPANARKVLVVDDNPDIRMYIRQNLGQEFLIQEAGNGEEGLEKALAEIPDLIISDVMMPRVDGIEFTRMIKLNEHSSHIPVVLLTAKTSEESQLEGLETGADDYIMKPFSIEVLKVRVHNLIETREKLREHFIKDPLARPEKYTTNEVDRNFMDKMEKIIEENMGSLDFGPEGLAREMAMSRTLLYMKMKALTGVTVNDYIKTIRLNKAAKLLLEQEVPVNEVAEMVGFKNPKHFSTAFSKQFGLPPSQYGKKKGNLDS